MAPSLQLRLFELGDRYWRPANKPALVLLTAATSLALLASTIIYRRKSYEPKLLPPPPKDFVYRLSGASESSAVLVLPNGRKIGYAQYGDLNGAPIIVLHGLPGSRLENALFDANAKELGARIIGIERPGIGLSSPDPTPLRQRRVIDHAADVQALAEHLRLPEYAVIGVSGGGPYALGCASVLSQPTSQPPLRAVAIMTGLGLPDMSHTWPKIALFLNRNLHLGWLSRLILTRSAMWRLSDSDDQRMESMRLELDLNKAHPADVEIASHPDYPDWARLAVHSTREAVAQGWAGYENESVVLCKDPGFRVEQIPSELPVYLWYGTDDTNVAAAAGNETASRMRNAGHTQVTLHIASGETHGSTQVKYQRSMLEAILKHMGRSMKQAGLENP